MYNSFERAGIEGFTFESTGGMFDHEITVTAPDGVTQKTFDAQLDGEEGRQQFAKFQKWASSQTPKNEVVDLPKITAEDIKVREEFAIKRLKERYEGLGFSFEGAGGPGDYITITAPEEYEGQPMEERISQTFSFDKGILGSDIGLTTSFSGIGIGTSPEEEARRANEFIMAHYKKGEKTLGIDAEIYASTISNTFELAKSFKNRPKDMTAKELENAQVDAFYDMFTKEGIFKNVMEEISPALDIYQKEQIEALSKQYDLTTQTGVDSANKDLSKLMQEKQKELLESSSEYEKLIKSVNAGVTSRYGSEEKQGSLINRAFTLEAEKELLPYSSFLRKIPVIGDAVADFSSGFGAGRLQVAKGSNDYLNIVAAEIAMTEKKSELKTLKERIKSGESGDSEYVLRSEPSIKDNVTTVIYKGTIGDRIKVLEKGIKDNTVQIQEGIAKSIEYQKKII